MTEIYEGERLDDLLIDNMKLIQRSDQFCFSIDAVLLAHFGNLKPSQEMLDLGTGTGVIPLLLSARGAASLTGIELNPVMAKIAQRNVRLNSRLDKIMIIEGDYRHLSDLIESGTYDIVYANPPYRETARGYVSPVTGLRLAKHETTATLVEVLRAVRYAVKYRGRFRMIHLAERCVDIMAAMRHYDLEPKVLQFIHSRRDEAAKLLLVEGLRGGKPGIQVLPPVIIYDDNGNYSQTVRGWYGK